MADALTKYRPMTKADALSRYKAAAEDENALGVLARYLGLEDYWNRQGRIANESLQMAEEGARAAKGGDLSGIGRAVAGPLRYLLSPVEALVPDDHDVYGSNLPDWAKRPMSSAMHGALFAIPGPDLGPAASAAGQSLREAGSVYGAGATHTLNSLADRLAVEVPEGVTLYGAGPVIRKPLGRGLDDLAGDATASERAALAARLEAEAGQAQNAGMTNDILYHGGDPLDLSKFERGGNVYWTTPSREYAENYGNIAGEHRLSPDARILDLSEVSPTTSLTADEFIELLSGRGVTVRPDGPKFLHDLMPDDVGPPELLQYLQRQDVIDDIAKNFDVIKQNEYIAGRTNGTSSAVSYGVLNPSALTVPASRDQALRNLTEAPKPRGLTTQSYKETLEDGTTRWVPGTLRTNPPPLVFDSELTPADMKRLGVANILPRKKGEVVTQSYKETLPDGTTRWVPGTLRAKRPPKK